MKIVGCDLHTRYQQIAMLDEETGELIERRLEHASGEAEEFYRLRQDYQRLKLRRGGSVAKVAIARKLAVRMYWMLRRQMNYTQLVRMQGSSRGTLVQQ